jgi:hypothetical protein
MRVTIEKDNGETEVFQNITDLYIAYRQEVPVYDVECKFDYIPQVRSHSWGSNVRELVKEVQQSLVELQDFLRGQRT